MDFQTVKKLPAPHASQQQFNDLEMYKSDSIWIAVQHIVKGATACSILPYMLNSGDAEWFHLYNCRTVASAQIAAWHSSGEGSVLRTLVVGFLRGVFPAVFQSL